MIRRSFGVSRRACWEPTDWRSSASSRSSRASAARPGPPGDDRRLVERVGELGAGHPGRLAGHVGQVEVGPQRLSLGVRAQDRLAAVAVRRRDQHLAVEAPRPQQRLVELVDVVGGGDHDHRPRVLLEPVELDQQLVQRLLALARAAIPTAAAARPPDRVQLVDEDDGSSRLPRLLEQAPDAGGSPPHEHLDEARSRRREEVDSRLRGDRPREHRLAGPRRAEEQHAARRLRAERLEALRLAQPFRHVDQLVLGGVDALHLLPEHGLGLARLDRLRLGRAERAAQQRDEDQQQAEHEEDPEDRVPVEEEAFDFGGGERQRQQHRRSFRPNVLRSYRISVRRSRFGSGTSRGRPASRRRSPPGRRRRRRSRPCCRRRSRAPRASASPAGPRR